MSIAHFSYWTLTSKLRETLSSSLAKGCNRRWPRYQNHIVPWPKCSADCPAQPYPPHNCVTWSPSCQRCVSAGRSRVVSRVSDRGCSQTRSVSRAASAPSPSTTARTWQIHRARVWIPRGSCAASRRRCTWRKIARSGPRSLPDGERSAWETAGESAASLREIVSPL